MRFYIVKRCWWLFWAEGMVVWPFVFFRPKVPNHRLVRHEFEHCYLVHRMGVLKFYSRYIWLLIKHGYRNHPDEKEAYRIQWTPLTVSERIWLSLGKVYLPDEEK